MNFSRLFSTLVNKQSHIIYEYFQYLNISIEINGSTFILFRFFDFLVYQLTIHNIMLILILEFCPFNDLNVLNNIIVIPSHIISV